MATRLIETVTATDVPAGGTVVIPHHVNVGGTGKIPDWISRDNMGFAGIAADSSSVTVRNDTTAAASITLYLFYDHTTQRVYGNAAVQQLTPAPFWIGGASSIISGGGGGIVTEFVYQPGGTAAGPAVFADFASLYTALVAARAAAGGDVLITLGYDSSLGAVAIPAGVYDFTNVLQVGCSNGGGRTEIAYADGTSFTGARYWRDLVVTNLNTTTPPISDIIDGDQFTVSNTVVQSTTGSTIALFHVALAGGQAVTFGFCEGAALGGTETGRVISVSNSAHQTRIQLDALSTIAVPAAVSNGGFGMPILVVTAPSMIQVPRFTSWSGGSVSPGPALATPASLLPMPYLDVPGGAIASPGHGRWLRLSTEGGAVSQTLPAIANATDGFGAAGVLLLVTNASTLDTATLLPATDDTILGLASLAVPGGGAVLLISDGVSQWSVVAAYGPTAPTVAIPQKLMTPGWTAAMRIRALNPDQVYCTFLGYAWQDFNAGEAFAAAWGLDSSGSSTDWGEIALGTGDWHAGQAPVVAPVAVADIASVLDSGITGAKLVMVVLPVSIPAGTGLWAITGAAAGSVSAVTANEGDPTHSGQIGVVTTPGWRPSSHLGEATTFDIWVDTYPRQAWSRGFSV